MFQSSPTSKGGRYAQGGIVQAPVSGFNPRPPLEVGATFWDLWNERKEEMFQSSPTPRGGRYLRPQDNPFTDIGVSILAHP